MTIESYGSVVKGDESTGLFSRPFDLVDPGEIGMLSRRPILEPVLHGLDPAGLAGTGRENGYPERGEGIAEEVHSAGHRPVSDDGRAGPSTLVGVDNSIEIDYKDWFLSQVAHR